METINILSSCVEVALRGYVLFEYMFFPFYKYLPYINLRTCGIWASMIQYASHKRFIHFESTWLEDSHFGDIGYCVCGM